MKKETKPKKICVAVTEKMYKDIKRLNMDVASLVREQVAIAVDRLIKDTKAK